MNLPSSNDFEYSNRPGVAIYQAMVEQDDVAKTRQILTDFPRLRRKEGVKLFCHAASYSSPKILEVLCELGANVNEADANRDTPLSWAIRKGNVTNVTWLLEHGAAPNLHSPLYFLSQAQPEEATEILRQFIHFGGDVNQPLKVPGMPTRNALTRAMMDEQPLVVETLRNHGALLPHQADARIKNRTSGEIESDILSHLQKNFGTPLDSDLSEIECQTSGDHVHIGLIPASDEHSTDHSGDMLFTMGLNHLGFELLLDLGNTSRSFSSLSGEQATSWPQDCFATLASRLGDGKIEFNDYAGVIPNGEPPQRFSFDTEFTGWLYGCSENELTRCDFPNGQTFAFYQIFPLYASEISFYRANGSNDFFARLQKIGFPSGIDEGRKAIV
ncbi:suppressor of fused domain protein [Stieleria sp. JC731]|uniref:suppressor of fused domain protein n=1 Tax=Pirellulaceae TaxID=2691357 RepID=UPI001E641D33|nr:suppressor of fused domain protein [Stieleria sp. JC731]MCC9602343.1 suppressor of fused domain protein [Stieleria sp. JC731]